MNIFSIVMCLERSILRPLQNVPFRPFSASGSNFNPPPNFGGLILKILHVFLWLKFSPSLNLNEIEHFSKVSSYYKRNRNYNTSKGILLPLGQSR